MKVVIVGIGGIGWELANDLTLRGGHDVVLIEQDGHRCQKLAETFDALVLEGDGTNPEMLKKAQVPDADALVATTGSDALNTVIAMLGHRFEVPKIIVKLNDVGLRSACEELGVTKIIAPSISAAAQILAVLSGFDRMDFSVVARGGLHLAELEVMGEGGVTLRDLEFPDGARVAAVLRDDKVLIAHGRTRLEKGDMLLTLVASDKDLVQVRRLLGHV